LRLTSVKVLQLYISSHT